MKKRSAKKVGEILIEKGIITLDQLALGLAEQKKNGASLGSALVRLGCITFQQLEAVLNEALEKWGSKKVGEILLENKTILPAQLKEALALQHETGRMVGEILLEKKWVSARQIFDALSTQFDVKSVDVDRFLFKKDVISLLPAPDARRLVAIPLQIANGRLVVAVPDPFDEKRIAEVEALAGLPVEPAYAPEENIRKALDREFSITPFSSAESPGTGHDRIEARKIIDLIMGQAISEGAAFVHLGPAGDSLAVRFRVDGRLESQSPVPAEFGPHVLDCLKEMARLAVQNRRTIQTGYFSLNYEGADAHFKISTFPVLTDRDSFREKVTLKVLNRGGEFSRLESLGFYRGILQQCADQLKTRNGTLIVAGPVDGGVTTTLYAALRWIQTENVNISTIERSIEDFIPGIAQTQVDLAAGFTFKQGLKSVLMEDADVVMVGEMDDPETANLVIKSGLHGRLMLTSLHASEASSVYGILRDMGVEPLALANGIKGVLAQRLVRRICSDCRETYDPPEKILEELRIPPKTPFYRGKGCQACNFSGFRGRTGLFELLVPDDALRQSIQSGADPAVLHRTAVEKGMMSLRMDGLKKVLEGITTLDQVVGASLPEAARKEKA